MQGVKLRTSQVVTSKRHIKLYHRNSQNSHTPTRSSSLYSATKLHTVCSPTTTNPYPRPSPQPRGRLLSGTDSSGVSNLQPKTHPTAAQNVDLVLQHPHDHNLAHLEPPAHPPLLRRRRRLGRRHPRLPRAAQLLHREGPPLPAVAAAGPEGARPRGASVRGTATGRQPLRCRARCPTGRWDCAQQPLGQRRWSGRRAGRARVAEGRPDGGDNGGQ